MTFSVGRLERFEKVVGCETANAVKTVSGQYAPVPLTRIAN